MASSPACCIAAGLAADGMVSLMARRLGERPDYSAYRFTLGRAVHYDAALLLTHAEDTSFRFDGLGSSWLVQMGRGGGSHPRDSQCDEMDLRTQRERDLRRLMDAIRHLRDYDPHLHHVAFNTCVVGGHQIMPGRGLRHSGHFWDAMVRDLYDGDDGKLWEHLQRAWSFVAVLAVDAAILKAAQEAGAVDEKAEAWATERKLLDGLPRD